MKHIFIINPKSGKGRKAKMFAAAAELYLKNHNLDGYVYRTTGPRDGMRHAEEVAKKGEPVRFYSCGGDGTLKETVCGMMELKLQAKLGYIPCGTTNDFAHSLHIPTDFDDAVETILGGYTKAIDIGDFNGKEQFIYVSCFGNFCDVSYKAKQSYIPFKLNSAGVMPVIFASSLIQGKAVFEKQRRSNGILLGNSKGSYKNQGIQSKS